MNAGPWHLLQGQVIDGRYHLTELRGTGGYAAVFEANEVVEDRLVRKVAVKLIPVSADMSSDRQFEELQLACRLDHPNVLRYYSVGRVELAGQSMLYLAMELGEETLADRLQRGTLSVDECRELAEHVVGALSYIHGRPEQLVHRDLKPANIMRVGDRWRLFDLGIARPVGADTMVQTSALGTPGYAPPESYDGIVSCGWDIWSFGVILVEALSGSLPFAGNTLNQLQQSIISEPPAIPSDMPAPFADIVRGCLIKDRQSRWTLSQVQQALAGQIHSTPPPQPQRTSQPPSQQPQPSQPVSHQSDPEQLYAWRMRVRRLSLYSAYSAVVVVVAGLLGLSIFGSIPKDEWRVYPDRFKSIGGYAEISPRSDVATHPCKVSVKDPTGRTLVSASVRIPNYGGGEIYVPANTVKDSRQLTFVITDQEKEREVCVTQEGNPKIDEARVVAVEAGAIIKDVEEKLMFLNANKNRLSTSRIIEMVTVLRQKCRLAVDQSQRAIQLAPGLKEPYIHRGKARYYMIDNQTGTDVINAAIKEVEQALMLFPNDPDLYSLMRDFKTEIRERQ